MFIKSIFPRLVSTFPTKLQYLKKLSTFTLSDKCYYCVLRNLQKQVGHITFTGGNTRCLSVTNKTNILSKTMSGEGDRNLNVNYDDIVKAQNDDNILIIDVREDSEIQETGKLPGSIHIPMAEVSNVLTNLSDQDFEDKFKRKKPTQDSRIILSCRSGRRSAMVQSEIQKLGYKNAYNYSGGWLDWEGNSKA